MDIQITDLLDDYKTRLADATHENVILKAQLRALESSTKTLEERLAQLESRDAVVESDEPVSESVIEGSVVED